MVWPSSLGKLFGLPRIHGDSAERDSESLKMSACCRFLAFTEDRELLQDEWAEGGMGATNEGTECGAVGGGAAGRTAAGSGSCLVAGVV